MRLTEQQSPSFSMVCTHIPGGTAKIAATVINASSATHETKLVFLSLAIDAGVPMADDASQRKNGIRPKLARMGCSNLPAIRRILLTSERHINKFRMFSRVPFTLSRSTAMACHKLHLPIHAAARLVRPAVQFVRIGVDRSVSFMGLPRRNMLAMLFLIMYVVGGGCGFCACDFQSGSSHPTEQKSADHNDCCECALCVQCGHGSGFVTPTVTDSPATTDLRSPFIGMYPVEMSDSPVREIFTPPKLAA